MLNVDTVTSILDNGTIPSEKFGSDHLPIMA